MNRRTRKRLRRAARKKPDSPLSARSSLQRTIAQGKSLLRRYPLTIAQSLRDPAPLAPVSSLSSSSLIATPDSSAAPPSDRALTLWRDALRAGPPLAAMWLGHASVLLRIGDLTVLTDPVFSPRIGPRFGSYTIGPRRLTPVPFDPSDLPRIDVILISHAHYDHLDRPTLRALASRHTTVLTARGTRRLIPAGFGHILTLDWDRDLSLDGVAFSAFAPAHTGRRLALDAHRRSNAYLMDSSARRVLFGGDTARTSAFRKLPNLDLALLGIGAYAPRVHAHATPEQVWRMFTQSRARHLLPMHHSTFSLSDEHPDEPLQRLLKAAGPQHAQRIIARSIGSLWTDESASGAASIAPGA